MKSHLATALLALMAGGAVAGAQQVYKPGGDVGFPVLLRQEAPRYSSAARQAGLEGVVEVDAVVNADGSVGHVRVRKSLDWILGLDDAAVTATKHWLFRPGMKGGMPVATSVIIILEFKLMNACQAPAAALTSDDFSRGVYPEDAPGLVQPRLTKVVEPKYSVQARRADIAGCVTVDAVVLPDGKVARARVSKSLDRVYGLDAEAIAEALQYQFEPGQLNGQAVPVLVRLTLEFRVH